MQVDPSVASSPQLSPLYASSRSPSDQKTVGDRDTSGGDDHRDDDPGPTTASPSLQSDGKGSGQRAPVQGIALSAEAYPAATGDGHERSAGPATLPAVPMPAQRSELAALRENSLEELPPDPRKTREATSSSSAANKRWTSSKHRRKSQDGDITSDAGTAEAAAGGSPLGSYLSQMGDKQRETMERIYTRTVDGPCQTITSCEQGLEEVFSDLNCQFLPFLKDTEDDGQGLYDQTPTIGPKSCEYCKANSTNQCDEDCERPKLFFLKKRPPFADKEGWDPETEYRIDPFEASSSMRGTGAGNHQAYYDLHPPSLSFQQGAGRDRRRGTPGADRRGAGGYIDNKKTNSMDSENVVEGSMSWTASLASKIAKAGATSGGDGGGDRQSWMSGFFDMS